MKKQKVKKKTTERGGEGTERQIVLINISN